MSQQEIERKFLVNGDYLPFVTQSHEITQGYLSTNPDATVRVRIKDNKAFLTIKGKSDKEGLSRFEWEKEINITDAQNLISLCKDNIIIKTRYIVPSKNGLFYEIDVFKGSNDGLVLAELELPDANFIYEKPVWLGVEVTGKSEYYNSNLIKNPFSNWK